MTEAEAEKAFTSEPATRGTLESGVGELEGLSVLLIEEDELIRESLIDWLASVLVDARIVGRTFEEAEALASREEPTVIVVDIALIGRDGIDVVSHLHRIFPEAQIVALSIGEDRQRQGAVLEAGAAACLPAWEVRDKLESTLHGLLMSPKRRSAPGDRSGSSP
jgi:two-component system response regulator NreC